MTAISVGQCVAMVAEGPSVSYLTVLVLVKREVSSFSFSWSYKFYYLKLPKTSLKTIVLSTINTSTNVYSYVKLKQERKKVHNLEALKNEEILLCFSFFYLFFFPKLFLRL